MITGINHITFAVSDITQSIHFYSDILGLRLIASWNKGAYLLGNDLWIALLEEDNISRSKDYSHIAFNIDKSGYKDIVKRLELHNITTYKENSSEGDSYYFYDPDYHKLELHIGTIWDRLKWANSIDWQSFKVHTTD